MSLAKHAEYELKKAGLFDKDSDYGGMIGQAVLELIEAFAAQGHSGFSAMQTLAIFDRVARFKTLTPISSDPSEWMEVTKYFNGKGVWQNLRNPSVFSEDGGQTWYDIDEREKNKWFRLQRRVRWIAQDLRDFFKYTVLRAKKPKVEPLEIAGNFAEPLPPEQQGDDNASV